MLSSLYKWATGEPTGEPTGPASVSLQVVRIPANGSTPHLIQLNTIDIRSEGNVDSNLFHIPDFRPFWGTPGAWRHRDLVQVEAERQPLPQLNGFYYGFKSFDMDELPISGYTGFCGDAFIVKVTAQEYGLNGWPTYEDVPDAFLRSPLLNLVLERLRKF